MIYYKQKGAMRLWQQTTARTASAGAGCPQPAASMHIDYTVSNKVQGVENSTPLYLSSIYTSDIL